MIHDETSTFIRRVINLSIETSTKQLNLYIYDTQFTQENKTYNHQVP